MQMPPRQLPEGMEAAQPPPEDPNGVHAGPDVMDPQPIPSADRGVIAIRRPNNRRAETTRRSMAGA